MYTQNLPILYPDEQLAVSFVTGQHTVRFHEPRILTNPVPLGFCSGGFSSTAGYDPATKLNFRRAACPLRRVLFQRVPLVLIQVVRESLATFSSKPFGFDSGRH